MGDGRIRVLRVIARMNVGGPALQVSGLMEHLDPARFDHRLLTGSVEEDEGDFLSLRAPHLPVRRVDGLGRSPDALGDARALAQLVREMRRFRPHLVHTHTAKAGFLGRVAAQIAGVPAVVHTFHGHLLHGYFSPLVTRGVIRVERALARRTSTLVAVGEKVREDLLRAGIGRPEQFRVVPPGIPLAPLPPRDEARRLLDLPADVPVVAIVARLVPVKRVDRFVEAATVLARARPDVAFLVCGDGAQLPALQAAASPLGGRVRFAGWRPDVETVYAASDVVALTSDNEGMPVSLIEAGLAGLPSVSTRVGSVAEVVRDGETGLLTGSEPGEIAAALGRLVSDPGMRHAFGTAARRHTETRFGVDRLVSDTARIYEELVGTESRGCR